MTLASQPSCLLNIFYLPQALYIEYKVVVVVTCRILCMRFNFSLFHVFTYGLPLYVTHFIRVEISVRLLLQLSATPYGLVYHSSQTRHLDLYQNAWT